jgi:predicted metalloprotease
MRLEDMRRSGNVEDRRGLGIGRGAGIGIGTVVLLIAGYFFGISPTTMLDVINGAPSAAPAGQVAAPHGAPADVQGDFAAAVLGETEDVWSQYFATSGQRYVPPTLVLFSGEVASACGNASAAAGPFYCPGDRKLYLDLDFFRELSGRFGAPGQFARAYVIAHEVGHHLQTLLGTTAKLARRQAREGGDTGPQSVSVAVELQADCYAGVWAMHAQRVIEPGEIRQALQAAAAVGDDTLQRRTQGRVVPETFTHGSAAQRQHWFQRGYDGGRLEDCNTFAAAAQR